VIISRSVLRAATQPGTRFDVRRRDGREVDAKRFRQRPVSRQLLPALKAAVGDIVARASAICRYTGPSLSASVGAESNVLAVEACRVDIEA
jgi:hypothetical protein